MDTEGYWNSPGERCRAGGHSGSWEGNRWTKPRRALEAGGMGLWREWEEERSGLTPGLLTEQEWEGKTGEGAFWGANEEFCPIPVCAGGQVKGLDTRRAVLPSWPSHLLI